MVYLSKGEKEGRFITHSGYIQISDTKETIFEYEHEIRIILVHDFSNIDPRNPGKWLGTGIGWDPDQHLENIWVHPDATFWFMETVIETVRSLAPKLYNNGSPRVPYSNINTLPPI